MAISFKIKHKQGKARVGELKTDHGVVQTPTVTTNFTPALLRSGLKASDLKPLGAQMVLMNVLHNLIADVKDAHEYLGWNGPIFCDSGGFQMVSLSSKTKITHEGVEFELDGKKYNLNPKKVGELQKNMGMDIIMPLDRVITVFSKNPFAYLSSVFTTIRWFKKAREAAPDNTYYITQGGLNYFARWISLWDAKKQLESGVPGVAIGGIALGESMEKMYSMTKFCTDRLPENKPRHLLGVGTPIELLESIDLGIDTFDCVAATREARHGRLWTEDGYIRLGYEKHKKDAGVIEEGCDCPACKQGVTRSDIVKAISNNPEDKARRNEALKHCMLHNIRFIMRLMERSQKAIQKNRYQEFKKNFIARYK
ncbi:MAG: tRNA guanosine(34) transglycosylase Tgt [Patescibacteria group bacterium]|nr:tRNA guanosine(34) transglycosylase Tgt [Patescibacteria group bacterium]